MHKSKIKVCEICKHEYWPWQMMNTSCCIECWRKTHPTNTEKKENAHN
jgi:hypothetical protein